MKTKNTPLTESINHQSKLSKLKLFSSKIHFLPKYLAIPCFLILFTFLGSLIYFSSNKILKEFRFTSTPQFANAEKVTMTLSNITLTPIESDSSGVKADTAFILKSDQTITEEAVKDNLSFSSGITYKTEKISDTEIKVVPTSNLSDDSIHQVLLTGSTVDLNKKEMSWAYQVQGKFRVLESFPRNEGTQVPVSSGIEVTFSHDNYADVNDFFLFHPKFLVVLKGINELQFLFLKN